MVRIKSNRLQCRMRYLACLDSQIIDRSGSERLRNCLFRKWFRIVSCTATERQQQAGSQSAASPKTD